MPYEAREFIAGNGTTYTQIFEDGEHVADVVEGREDLAEDIVTALNAKDVAESTLSGSAPRNADRSGDGSQDSAGDLKCGFCGRPSREVQALTVAHGGTATICDDCIDLAARIKAGRAAGTLVDNPPKSGRQKMSLGTPSSVRLDFCRIHPNDLKKAHELNLALRKKRRIETV